MAWFNFSILSSSKLAEVKGEKWQRHPSAFSKSIAEPQAIRKPYPLPYLLKDHIVVFFNNQNALSSLPTPGPDSPSRKTYFGQLSHKCPQGATKSTASVCKDKACYPHNFFFYLTTGRHHSKYSVQLAIKDHIHRMQGPTLQDRRIHLFTGINHQNHSTLQPLAGSTTSSHQISSNLSYCY